MSRRRAEPIRLAITVCRRPGFQPARTLWDAPGPSGASRWHTTGSQTAPGAVKVKRLTAPGAARRATPAPPGSTTYSPHRVNGERHSSLRVSSLWGHYPNVVWAWASYAGTVVLGLAGMTITYVTGRRQASNARQIAKDQADVALRTQREERHQRRIEVAYPEMLNVLAEGEEWLDRVGVFLKALVPEPTDVGPVDKMPPRPEALRLGRTRGEIAAVWSPMVEHLFHIWVSNLTSAWQTSQSHYPPSGTWETDDRGTQVYLPTPFEQHRREAYMAALQVREQVWKELRSEHSGHFDQEAYNAELNQRLLDSIRARARMNRQS